MSKTNIHPPSVEELIVGIQTITRNYQAKQKNLFLGGEESSSFN
jgi:hypothetical protein